MGFNAAAQASYPFSSRCTPSTETPGRKSPRPSVNVLLMLTNRTFLPSANFANCSLICLMAGTSALFWGRGKSAVSTIVAPGAFSWKLAMIAWIPPTTSPTASPWAARARGDCSCQPAAR